MSDVALEQRVQDLESRMRCQAREIRALERIEGLLDRSRELETENRCLREKVEELRTFWTLSKTLSVTLNMDELLRLTLHLIGRSLHVNVYSLMLLEEGGTRLSVRAAFGLPEDGIQGLSVSLGEGVSGLVAWTGQAMLVPDVSAEPRCVEATAFGQVRGSFIVCPSESKGARSGGAQRASAGPTGIHHERSRPVPSGGQSGGGGPGERRAVSTDEGVKFA